MGALARPGPQMGRKGPPEARRRYAQPFSQWFPGFLRDELRPYPGRVTLVLRMTLAATLTMLAIMTFRLPGAAIAAYYTLILSRDSPVTTLRTAGTVMLCYLLGSAYALICLTLFVDYPLTHFLWVAVSLFLCFYVIKVTTNYTAGAAFAFVITIIIPLWDTALPTAALVGATLWTAGSVSVGLLCTVAVEYLFSLFQETRTELEFGLAARIDATSAFLRSYAGNTPEKSVQAQRVQQLAMVGVSRLRRLAANPGAGPGTPERRGTTVSLVGRIVDLTAALKDLEPALDDEARQHLVEIAYRLATLERHLGSRAPAAPMPPAHLLARHPLIGEIEKAVRFLQISLSSGSPDSLLPLEKPTSGGGSLLVSDAFTNHEHLTYSLRGCLAAMLCYLIFNGIAWRGLSTSLATCVITALSSVGASRQKQLLRISGAMAGGIFFGIGSQVLILPMLDSISGFTTVFVAVTLTAAWFGTSSPRLSYFGQQIALAFYLINLQEPFPQTSLAIARDRVVGIALGLIMMWLVFDTLGSRPAAVVMREIFAGNLRLLAQFARPWRDGRRVDLNQLRALRDKISSNFSSVNAQADAVLFELGPTRERDLALRDRLLAWQPRLRSLFLLEVALVQYRAQVKPQELPPAILEAQTAFDEKIEAVLRDLADAFSARRPPAAHPDVRSAYRQLEKTIDREYRQQPTPRAQGVLTFSASLADLLDDLSRELAGHAAR